MKNLRELLQQFVGNKATQEDKKELESAIRQIWENEAEQLRPDEEAESHAAIYNRVSKKGKIISLKPAWLAAAACIIAIAVTGLIYLNPTNEPKRIALAQNTFTGKDFVHLPDGTDVTLNEGATLTYTFSDTARIVELDGEAFFDVFHDPKTPFYVKSGKLYTRVLGTAFSVRSYTPHKNHKVAVTRGKVQVGMEAKSYAVLSANEEIEVNTETEQFKKRTLSYEESQKWLDDFFVLDAVSFPTMAGMIEKRFHQKVKFANPAFENCKVSAKFLHNESLTDILELLSTSFDFKYTMDNSGVVTIDGPGCAQNP
jgi:transmembrane sensor